MWQSTLAVVAKVQWRGGGTHKDLVPRLEGRKLRENMGKKPCLQNKKRREKLTGL